jgi:hypothetical protein
MGILRFAQSWPARPAQNDGLIFWGCNGCGFVRCEIYFCQDADLDKRFGFWTEKLKNTHLTKMTASDLIRLPLALIHF